MNVVPYAIVYAHNINEKKSGYTIENAKKIYGKYYPIVEKYLLQEKSFRQALELQFNALIIASAQRTEYLAQYNAFEAFISRQRVMTKELIKDMNDEATLIENKGSKFIGNINVQNALNTFLKNNTVIQLDDRFIRLNKTVNFRLNKNKFVTYITTQFTQLNCLYSIDDYSNNIVQIRGKQNG